MRVLRRSDFVLAVSLLSSAYGCSTASASHAADADAAALDASTDGGVSDVADGAPSVDAAANLISGTLGGIQPGVASAVASYRSITVDSIPGLDLILSSAADDCTDYVGRSFTQVEIELPGDPLVPGTYTVVPSGSGTSLPTPGQGIAYFESTTDCATGSSEGAKSGTVTFSEVGSSGVRGMFDPGVRQRPPHRHLRLSCV